MKEYDAIVLGAGYYGCRIALRLRSAGLKRVALVDRETTIMARASMWNQARVHGGYHYPRAYLTALASRRSYQRFLDDHADAVLWGVRSLYAIAKNSYVPPSQFEKLCEAVGAPLRAPPRAKELLFDSELVAAVYLADEIGLDATRIAHQLLAAIKRSAIDLMLAAPARVLEPKGQRSRVSIGDTEAAADFIFNCAYSEIGLNGVRLNTILRHEWAEMALIEPPSALAEWGVTIMDGPFFSALPFPSRQLHTLSHVRFTPVVAWHSNTTAPPPPAKPGIGPPSNASAMLRDATRYIPRMRDARIRASIYEVKTTLAKNEGSDGRPILFEVCEENPRVVSVLGSKLDNIYDVLSDVDGFVNSQFIRTNS